MIETYCERSDCNPETCAHSSHRKVSGGGYVSLATFSGGRKCPDCTAPVVISDDQSPCIFTLLFEEHGNQDWYDCPSCGATWETNELVSGWRCVTLGEDNLDDFVETLNALAV